MSDTPIKCGPDGCDIDYGEIEARRKLDEWFARMQPMDYDAPGGATREQEGVTR